MGRGAAAKLTSEERCRKAFAALFGLDPSEASDGHSAFEIGLWQGWRGCWRYLQEHVAKEYIEA